MEFGKLKDISQVDFTLPEDDPHNRLLSFSKDEGDFKIYIGSARWGERALVGKIYPPKTAARDYLFYYSRQFDTIEMNTTHYRIPTVAVVEEWCEKAHPGFLFCPKVPQMISHSPDFGQYAQATEQFVAAIYAFEQQLGMPFLQLPPDFSPQMGRLFFDYLRKWPRDLPLAVEFRHPNWFSNARIKDRAFDLLQEMGISPVITDTAGRRDVVHQRLTNSKVLIRFVGNRLHATDYLRIDSWVQRLKQWRETGLKTVFFIVHQPEENYCVDLAIYLVKKLNQTLDMQIAPPRILPIGKQQSLF